MKKRVGIIGGGAAGLFTACLIKRFSNGEDIEVTILEKSSAPGKKLTLTGHGRCNITNRKDASVLKDCYHEAGNFIYPALKEFGPEDTIELIEKHIGLKTKEEDNNRIFPVCDSAVRVRDALLSYISGSTNILCDTKVIGIRKNAFFEADTAKGSYSFDYLVLSCGGSSFPKTGSSGDSYRLAQSIGHTIVPVRAALAPVNVDNDSAAFTKALSGVSLTAGISLYSEGKKVCYREGEILFAPFGLTGPAVMEMSREIPSDTSGKGAYLELDLIPSVKEEDFDREFQDLIKEHADTKITNLLARFVPASVASAVAERAGAEDLYAQGFTRENRRALIRETKHLGIGLERAPVLEGAYVTRGGVSLKEVDRKTCMSKIVPGLYIIGEALDIDGISGGFNLQACMSEAYLVSKDILN